MLEDFIVIVPAYNEETNINETINNLKKFFENILIINDGSNDKTLEIIDKNQVKIISHFLNLGQGASLETGFKYFLKYTNFKYLITFDADGQHSPEDAYKMALNISYKNYDAIIGSRFLNKGYTKVIPIQKLIFLKLANIYEKLFFSSTLTDSHNGLRVLSRKSIEIIMPLKNHDMGHATEISCKLCKSKLRYLEYPVNIKYQNKKSQSIINALNIFVNNFFRIF